MADEPKRKNGEGFEREIPTKTVQCPHRSMAFRSNQSNKRQNRPLNVPEATRSEDPAPATFKRSARTRLYIRSALKLRMERSNRRRTSISGESADELAARNDSSLAAWNKHSSHR